MTIREIAAKTNMSTDTLRYYERIGCCLRCHGMRPGSAIMMSIL